MELARAQKIIRVVGPRKLCVDDVIGWHRRVLRRIDERTEDMAKTERSIFSYVRVNNRYLQLILRYLIGYQPIRPTATDSSDSEATTAQTTQRTRTQVLTRRSR